MRRFGTSSTSQSLVRHAGDGQPSGDGRQNGAGRSNRLSSHAIRAFASPGNRRKAGTAHPKPAGQTPGLKRRIPSLWVRMNRDRRRDRTGNGADSARAVPRTNSNSPAGAALARPAAASRCAPSHKERSRCGLRNTGPPPGSLATGKATGPAESHKFLWGDRPGLQPSEGGLSVEDHGHPVVYRGHELIWHRGKERARGRGADSRGLFVDAGDHERFPAGELDMVRGLGAQAIWRFLPFEKPIGGKQGSAALNRLPEHRFRKNASSDLALIGAILGFSDFSQNGTRPHLIS